MPSDLDPLLRECEVAKILDRSPATLRDDRLRGRIGDAPAIPHVEVGRTVRYRRADVLAWLARQTRTGAPLTNELRAA